MSRKRKIPAGAKKRECPDCHQGFRPRTDAEWRWVWQLHITSERHKRAIGKSSEGPKS